MALLFCPAFEAGELRPNGSMLGAFGVYCFVFPWAHAPPLVRLDALRHGMDEQPFVGNARPGRCGLALGQLRSVGLIVSAGIFVLGLALEYLGVTTGFPFGPLPLHRCAGARPAGGECPLAIGFAWLCHRGQLLTRRVGLLLLRRTLRSTSIFLHRRSTGSWPGPAP